MSKGTGYIEKRDSDGHSWRLIISAGYHKGKQTRHTRTVKVEGQTFNARKKAAEKQLSLFHAEIETGTYLEPSKYTLEDYANQWLKDYAEQQLAPRTLESYRIYLRTRIIPALGHLKLQGIKPLHLIKFYNNLHEAGIRLDGKEGTLSAGTIRKCHSLLSSMFQKAVKWQLIPMNPASKVDPPKVSQKEMQCFDLETTAVLLQALDQEPPIFRTMIKLALVTGLRRGELMALQWKYINLDTGTVEVRFSLQYLVGEGMSLKEPKNRSSLRSISIPGSIVAMLKEHRKQQLENRLQAGTVWHESDFVFTQDDGQLMHIDTITKWFPLFLKRHNESIRTDPAIPDPDKEKLYLPIVNFHGLRHTAATLLIDQGLNVKAVSSRLGHAQTSTTTNIYAHALQTADRQAADMMEDIFESKPSTTKKEVKKIKGAD